MQSTQTLFENDITISAEYQFRIHYHSKIFKMVNTFSSFIVNDRGLQLNSFFPKINGKIFCFWHIYTRFITSVNKIRYIRSVVILITKLQTYYSSIVRKLNKKFVLVATPAITCIQDEGKWRQNTTLRWTSGYAHCIRRRAIQTHSLRSLKQEVENPQGWGRAQLSVKC